MKKKSINTMIMRVTKAERNTLECMAHEQNIKVERLVRDLIFKSGLIIPMVTTTSKEQQ